MVLDFLLDYDKDKTRLKSDEVTSQWIEAETNTAKQRRFINKMPFGKKFSAVTEEDREVNCQGNSLEFKNKVSRKKVEKKN